MKREDVYSVLLRPLVSERSHEALAQNKYTFLVKKEATKITIKQAVETIFGVKVEKVNTLWKPGKLRSTTFRGRRLRGERSGKTTSYKKAIVTLKEGETLPLFEI
jgi:large subunit ribosomal protein L23